MIVVFLLARTLQYLRVYENHVLAFLLSSVRSKISIDNDGAVKLQVPMMSLLHAKLASSKATSPDLPLQQYTRQCLGS